MLASILATAVFAQSPSWGVSTNGHLVYDGKPWIPIGLRIPASESALEAAKSAGINRVLIDIPEAGAKSAVAHAETLGMEYGLALNFLPPPSSGFLIQPEAYRYGPFTGKARLSTSIPGCTQALVALASTRDSSLLAGERGSKLVTLEGGKLDLEVDATGDGDIIALVFPLVTSQRIPDLWAGFDLHRDQLLSQFKSLEKSTGLRFLLDPLGNVPSFPEADLRYVPTDPRFRRDLEIHLQTKYGSPVRAIQAWEVIASDQQSYAELARLVPLWSSTRGIGVLFDPVSKKPYRADRRRSLAWQDIQAVIQTTLRRRYQALNAQLSRMAKVPVIQTWGGWNGPYSSAGSGLAGVGVRVEAAGFSELLSAAGRAVANSATAGTPPLVWCTDFVLPSGVDGLDRSYKPAIEDTAALGIRGWFFRAPNSTSMDWVRLLAASLSVNQMVNQPKPQLLPFPESAAWPASSMRLSSNTWSVPGSSSGRRLNYGGTIEGYSSESDGTSHYVLWSKFDNLKLKFLFSNPKNVMITSIDGLPVKSTVRKDSIELTLGPSPIIIRNAPGLPVPEQAMTWLQTEFTAILSMLPPQARDMMDEVISIQDGLKNWKKGPSEQFERVRSQLDRLSMAVSSYTWIEAEFAQRHNWSEVRTFNGASNREALSLNARIAPSSGRFDSTYTIFPRFDGSQNVWISARGDGLTQLQISCNGVTMSATDAGIQPYGEGYRWYKVGSLNLPRRQVQMTLSVPFPFTGSLDVDAIMIAPQEVSPTGPMPPPMVRIDPFAKK